MNIRTFVMIMVKHETWMNRDWFQITVFGDGTKVTSRSPSGNRT